MENTEKYDVIGAKEFLALLQAGDDVILKNIKVKQDILIDVNKIKGKTITIASGEFGRIYIYNPEKFKGNEKLPKEYLVSDEDAIAFNIYGGSFTSIYINEGHFKEFKIEGGKILDLHIYGGNFNIFYINNGYDIIEHFFIKGGIFRNMFTIDYGEFKLFHIIKGEFQHFVINGGEFNSFCIQNGIFNNKFTISGGKLTYFYIRDGIFNEIFNIIGKFTKFIIENGTFNKNFNVNEGKFDDFDIINGVFNGRFTMHKGQFAKFRIRDGVFNEFLVGEFQRPSATDDGIPVDYNKDLFFETQVTFQGGIFNVVRINYGKFELGLSLGFTEIKDSFIFIDGIFKHINIAQGKYESLIFTNCKIIDKIHFINNLTAKYISFEKNENVLPNLLFETCAIPAGTLIKINETHIENISFINSVNFGNIVFSGVKGIKNKATQQSTLKINNSDLGKTTFIDCNFEEMELDFRSSKITEVFLAGTKMPLKIKEEHNDKKEQTNLDQQRLGYGQLKKIYENRGDTVSANDYFAKEMNVVYSQIPWIKNSFSWNWTFRLFIWILSFQVLNFFPFIWSFSTVIYNFIAKIGKLVVVIWSFVVGIFGEIKGKLNSLNEQIKKKSWKWTWIFSLCIWMFSIQIWKFFLWTWALLTRIYKFISDIIRFFVIIWRFFVIIWKKIKENFAFGEKLILFFNKYSSNHGTSWTRAFWLTIIVASIFFVLYGFSIGLSLGSWLEPKNWALFYDYSIYFLEFINPIHKAEFIVENMNKKGNTFVEASNLSIIIENLARIFITYFIYQLIQAFRKHKKSST